MPGTYLCSEDDRHSGTTFDIVSCAISRSLHVVSVDVTTKSRMVVLFTESMLC